MSLTPEQKIAGRQYERARDDLILTMAQAIARIHTEVANLSGTTPTGYFELSERLSISIKNFQNTR